MSKAKRTLDLQRKIARFCKGTCERYKSLEDFCERQDDPERAKYYRYLRYEYEDILERIATDNWTLKD